MPDFDFTGDSNSQQPDEQPTDVEVLATACKYDDDFEQLFMGDDLGKEKHSADMTFLLKAAYWCQHDKWQLDRLFRMSERMYSKWDRPAERGGRTYGQLSIDKAVAKSDDTYDGKYFGDSYIPTEVAKRVRKWNPMESDFVY